MTIKIKHILLTPAVIVLLSASTAILVAHVVEELGFPPCPLCYYQRLPYYWLFCCSAFYLAANRYLQRMPLTQKVYLGIVLLAVAIELALAFFHVGVENGWFTYNAACTTELPPASSIEEVANNLKLAPIVSCLVPNVVILGISMAGWNFIFTASLLAFTIYNIHK